jgi:hypothetical protein
MNLTPAGQIKSGNQKAEGLAETPRLRVQPGSAVIGEYFVLAPLV